VLLGLVVMYPLQLGSADRTVQSQLRAYAVQVEQAVARGAFPRRCPDPPSDPAAQAQVLAPDGAVLAATRALAGLPALYRLPAGSAVPVRQQAADSILPGELFVFGEHATAGGRPVIVITSTATSLRRQVNETFAQLLVIRGTRAARPGLRDDMAGRRPRAAAGGADPPRRRRRHPRRPVPRVPETGTDDEIGDLARTMNDMLARLEDSAASSAASSPTPPTSSARR